MRKGRHRRHRDARDLKRTTFSSTIEKREPCDECQRWPHAEWCLAEEDSEFEDEDEA